MTNETTNATQHDVERLLELHELHGERSTYISRFYIREDDETYDLELRVSESALAGYFYDTLTKLYEAWLQEMTPAQRAELFEYNDSLGGANTNWLLENEERLARYKTI